MNAIKKKLEAMKRRREATEALRRCTLWLPEENDGFCEYYKQDFRMLAKALRGEIYILRYDRSIRRFFEEECEITPRPTQQQLRSLEQEVECLCERCNEFVALRYKRILEYAILLGTPINDAEI